MAPGPAINLDDFPQDFLEQISDPEVESTPASHETDVLSLRPIVPGGVEPLRKARERVEKSLILRALEITNGQRASAAELLEIKPRTLRQKMSDYGIEFRRTRKRVLAKSRA